jgi:hypothetical protein
MEKRVKRSPFIVHRSSFIVHRSFGVRLAFGAAGIRCAGDKSVRFGLVWFQKR